MCTEFFCADVTIVLAGNLSVSVRNKVVEVVVGGHGVFVEEVKMVETFLL